MATDFKKVLIPLAAAHPNRPLPNLPIPKLPSSSISKTPLQSPSLPSLYNVGGAQRSDTKMPQNGLIEISSDNKSDESNKLSLGSWHKFKSESGAGTENNVATAHTTRGGSRLPRPQHTGRPHRGDVGGTKMPPKDVIEISSDDEPSDGETHDDESYDDESYDDESSDDESSDEQQKGSPGCPPAPSSISRTAPSTKLSRLANAASAACQPGQASAPSHTTHSNTAPATDAASLVEHKAARPDHGCQRDPRPFAEPCGTTSNDNSKCLSHDERDKRHFRHDVQEPHTAASKEGEETRRESDGRYRSASHDHHRGGDQTSGSARRHPPVPDKTGKPSKDDPVRLLQVQERRASPSVLPHHQSISEPTPANAERRSQYRSSPSAASKHRVETQHRSGGSALAQHRNHHNDSNQTNGLKQGDARLPGGRAEQGVGSPFVASQGQGSGASVAAAALHAVLDRLNARLDRDKFVEGSSEAMSNNDRMLADVGPSLQPSVQPSASQDRVRLQHSLGRRPRSGTDVGDNPRPVEDGVREHGRGDVTQLPQKRRRISTSTPAVSETAPKGQADPHRASSRLQRTQRPTTRHATPCRSQHKIPKPRSAGVASTTKKPQGEYFNVENILDFQVRYLVQWEGYGSGENTWEPPEHFERCPDLLREFHERTGSVGEWIERQYRALGPRSTEAHRSAP
ncbi:hypothetical protein VTK26DRAFT_6315 [Humicola hyalothermophila]